MPLSLNNDSIAILILLMVYKVKGFDPKVLELSSIIRDRIVKTFWAPLKSSAEEEIYR